MKAITFCLRLLEPLLISQAEGGEENSAVGLSFVPGSALRGTLMSRYLHSHSVADPAADPDVRRLFLDGTVCFLNAYPWREGQRMLPRPMSWFTEKDVAANDQAAVFDWAVDPTRALRQAKAPAGDYCLAAAEGAALISPARQVDVHIALEDANYRGDKNKVFRYDALAAGELLAGAIVAGDRANLETILQLLEPAEIALGGAHLAGYGRACVEGASIDEDWHEYWPGDEPEDGRLVVTLLSDTVVRGAHGQVDGDLNAALAAALHLPGLQPAQSFQRLRLVGGFNRKWSLPLVQSWAAQAGSVYVYPASAFPDRPALEKLVDQGLGERRAEGMGRLAVNWHTWPQIQRYRAEPPALPEAAPLSGDSQQMARRMAGRRLQLLLERKLAEAVSGVELIGPLPQNAQLSRVRLAAQRALAQGDLQPVRDHLSSLKGAREQFERARVKTTPLLKWLEERATRQDVEVQLLAGADLPSVAGQVAILTDRLRAETMARLIDGVMRKAADQNREEGA